MRFRSESFGGRAYTAEMSSASWLDHIRQDLAYALRTHLRRPLLAVSAIATLALGIGANTAIFTVVNAVLLKPLPYRDPDGLVRVSGGGTYGHFEMIKAARSFSGVAANNVFTTDVTLSGDGEVSESLKTVRVSTNFLSVLGLSPLAGRSFVAAEESDGSCPVMISESLWRRRVAKQDGGVGGALRLGGMLCTVIGVLPRGFQFPFPDMDVWMPLQPAAIPQQARMHSPTLAVIGRLKEGVPLQQADAEIRLVNKQYALANPGALDAKPGAPENVVPLKDLLVRGVRPTLWMLMGAVGFLLGIACANIAGLLLVRARARSREIAVRLALGASRGRLTAHLLTESLLLAVAGGALGILLAAWVVRGAGSIPGLELPRVVEIHLDGTVLLFATALSISTGVLFGLAPSRLGFRADLMEVLRGGDELLASRGRHGWSPFPTGSRSLLVVFQVALSTVLLIGAVLLIESVARIRRVDLGFDVQNLLTMRMTSPRATASPAPGAGGFDEIIGQIRTIPGVTGAAVTLTLPATGFAGTPIWPVNGASPPLNKRPIAILQAVTPGYFGTLGIGLRRGRDFAAYDTASSPKVVIINEALARRFWPGYPREDPIGQSILAGASLDALRIVGIVSDVRQAGPTEAARAGIYRPRAQVPQLSAMLAVRTQRDPLQLVNAIRMKIAAVDGDVSVTAVKTMTDVLGESDGQRRGVTMVLGLFASIGLVLASIGIYGVVAYSVTARTREFGIRKALGAGPADVLQLVLGQGLKLNLAGCVIGLGAAVVLTRLLQGFLFEVSATDPAAFGGVAFLCTGVSLLASYLPARRAMRVEPALALRSDG